MEHLCNRFARQVFVFLATLAFVTASTVALAHAHTDSSSVDESHCAMCMAVHSATHVVAAPIVTLIFAAVVDRILLLAESFPISIAWQTLNQDRAPPSL
ncbi:MAG TPA: DUF2946 family protein [Candidatus Acidoferrales bacterium]|jgi:hypothetical protein|nr:DUF2946 family protein [Candidatus Acidoferrales bacterium]